MRYLDPRNDLVFKRIFGEHPQILRSFLNALLPNYQQLAGMLQAIGRVLPLSSSGLGWILPAARGRGIGLLVWVAKG